MTPLEILTAAIRGESAPRIPVFCNLLDQGARELGLSQQAYYARGEHVAEGQLRLRERYGHDNLWSLSYVGREAELFGCREILWADDGSPNVAEFVIRSWDDIARLTLPDNLTDHPAWRETEVCLRLLREAARGRYPICAYLTASNSLPALLMGMEEWLTLLLTGPADLRDELLRKCSELFRMQLAAYRAAGADVIIYSAPFGSTSLVGMKRFREFSLPWMKRDLEAAGVQGVVYYCGMAPFNNVIAPVMDELGIFLHYISPLADLAEAKALIGTRGLTCGVIDDIKLIRQSPAEARAEVRRICEIGMPGGHFLFGTGLMPMTVPEANIHAVIEAAFEYGSSP